MKRVIDELEKQMKEAARNLEFEKAAVLRDQIYDYARSWQKRVTSRPGNEYVCSLVKNDIQYAMGEWIVGYHL